MEEFRERGQQPQNLTRQEPDPSRFIGSVGENVGEVPHTQTTCSAAPLHPRKTNKQAEKMRVRALRALAAREEAEIDRDRALELTLEVLRRKHADKRRGVSTIPSAPGGTVIKPLPTYFCASFSPVFFGG